MRILAIDPGTRDFGVADYWHGEVALFQCRVAGANAEERRRRLLGWKEDRHLRDAGGYVNTVIVEKQYLRQGVAAQFSLAVSAGVLMAVLTGGHGVEELHEVAASSWNYRGRGAAAAAVCAKKHDVDLKDADDAKSALGLLLWYLGKEGIEAEVTSLHLHYLGLCGARTPGP